MVVVAAAAAAAAAAMFTFSGDFYSHRLELSKKIEAFLLLLLLLLLFLSSSSYFRCIILELSVGEKRFIIFRFFFFSRLGGKKQSLNSKKPLFGVLRSIFYFFG